MTSMMIAAAAASLANAHFIDASYVLVQGAPTASVSYRGLDLGSVSGRALLVGRIHSAAHSLCDDENIQPLEIRLAQLECYRVAVSGGVAQVGALSGRETGR